MGNKWAKFSKRAIQTQYSSKGKQVVLPDETKSETGNASDPTSHDASSDDKHGCRIWRQSWGASSTPDHVQSAHVGSPCTGIQCLIFQHHKDNNDHASPYRVDSVIPQEWEAALEEDIEHIGNLERREGSLSPCPSPRRGPWLRTKRGNIILVEQPLPRPLPQTSLS